MALDPKPFIHPLDRKALTILESMPGLKAVLRKYIDLYEAKWSEGVFLSSCIRLNECQLPHVYRVFEEVFEALEIGEDERPRCYLEMDPIPDAYAKGYYKKKFLVIKSGLLEMLSREELKVVIAHECGHALCDHMIYKSLVRNMGEFGIYLSGFEKMLTPFLWGLLYWDRCSAFSCDRISAYVMGDSDIVRNTLIRFAGGPHELTNSVNIEEYGRQIDDLCNELKDSKYQSLLQLKVMINQKYPFTAIRCKEVCDWYNDPTTLLPVRKVKSRRLSL